MEKHKLSDEAIEALDFLGKIEVTNNKIEEKLFVKKFLPLFLVEDAPRLFAWSEIAGSPYRPVDIMRNGVKVAEVPPLLIEMPLREFNGRTSMYEQVSTIVAETARVPGRGHDYIANRLTQLMPEPTEDKKLMEAWIKLINTYTKGETTEPEEGETNEETSFNNNLQEDLGFEEL